MENKNNITVEQLKQSLVGLSMSDLKTLGDMLAKDMGFDSLNAMLASSAVAGDSAGMDGGDAPEATKEKKFKIIFKALKEGQTMAAVKKVRDFFAIGLIDAKKKIKDEFVVSESCDESTKVTILQEWGSFAELSVEEEK